MGGAVEIVTGPLEHLAARFATLVTSSAAEAIRGRHRFTMAIPGGSVVERLIAPLTGAAIEWEHVDLFWCDERCVPATDPDSNFAAAKRVLLDALGGKGPRVHRLRGEDDDRPMAARRYAAELTGILGAPPSLDLAVLGVGEDGHVCSLFPGHRALHEMAELVVVEPDAPKPPPARLTMTLPMIAAARQVVLAAFGSAKSAVMRDVIEGRESGLPAAMALRAARRTTIFLDAAAAGLLTTPNESTSGQGIRDER